MRTKQMIKTGNRFEKVVPMSKAQRYEELAKWHDQRLEDIKRIGHEVINKFSKATAPREYYLVFGKKQYINTAAEKLIARSAGHTIHVEY